MNSTIYWAPRAFGLLFVFIVGSLAFDLEKFTWLGLLMHLIPAFLVLIALIIGWKIERVGTLLFFVLAILYVAMSWGRVSWLTHLVMAGPAVIIGLLFLIPRTYEREIEYSKGSSTAQANEQPAQPTGDDALRDQSSD